MKFWYHYDVGAVILSAGSLATRLAGMATSAASIRLRSTSPASSRASCLDFISWALNRQHVMPTPQCGPESPPLRMQGFADPQQLIDDRSL